MVPIVPRTVAEVGMEGWGGIGVIYLFGVFEGGEGTGGVERGEEGGVGGEERGMRRGGGVGEENVVGGIGGRMGVCGCELCG